MGAKVSTSQDTPVSQSTKPVSLIDILSTNNPVPTEEYTNRENAANPVTINAFNPKDYSDYTDNPNPNDPNLEYERAVNQPTSEKLLHTAAKFGTSLLGGALMSAGVSTDIEEGVKTAIGQEDEYNNALYNYGNDVLQYGNKNFPIYQKEQPSAQDGTFNVKQLSDPSFWMNQIAQQGLSLGIMGYSMGETALINSLTGGLGDVEEIPLAAKRANMLEKIFSSTSNSAKLRNNAMMYGVVNRHNESVMEATQTFQESYKSLIEKGVPEEKARAAAAAGAAYDYKMNMPLAVMDAIMMRTMTFNPVTGGSEGAVERLLSKVSTTPLRYAAKALTEMGSEGYEEWHQQVLGQNEGQYRADVLAGVSKETNFSDRLKKYMTQEDTWENTIGGMLGGLVMSPAGELYRHITEGQDSKSKKLAHSEFIKNTLSTSIQLADQIRQADENNKPQLALQLRQAAGEHQALSSLHLDNILDRDTAFQSYVDNLQNTLDIVNSGDQDKINELFADKDGNVNTGVLDHVKQEFPNYISDANKIKDLYETAKETVDPTAIIPIVSRQYHIGVMNDFVNNITPQIEQLKSSIPDYNELSEDGKFMFGLSSKLEIADKLEKEYTYQLLNAKNQADINGAVKALDEVRKTRVQLKNVAAQISTDTDRYTIKDRDIVASLPKQKKLFQLEQIKEKTEATKNQYRAELQTWNDKNFQKKNRDGVFHKEIIDANTPEQLNAIKDRLTNDKQITSEISDMIDRKLLALKIKGQSKSIINNSTNQTATPTLVDTLSTTQDEVADNITNPIVDDKKNNLVNDLLNDISNSFGSTLDNTIVTPSTITHTPTHSIVQEDTLFEKQEEGFFYDPKPVSTDKNVLDSFDKKIKLAHDTLKEGDKPYTFNEFIESMINASGRDKTEDAFNAIRDSWIRNGFKEANYQEVYNNIFRKAQDILRDIANPSNWGVTINNNVSNLLVAQGKETGNTEETETGAIVYLHGNKFVTSASMPKMAFLHRPYERKLIENEDGTITVTNEDVNEVIEKSDYIDSTPIMNPDALKAGTKFTIKLGTDNKVPVSKWSDIWERENGVPFDKWMADKGIIENSDKWLAKVPMFIHMNGVDKPIALVHDLDWYNPTNVGHEEHPDTQKMMIEQARQELLALRRAVVNNKGTLEAIVLANDKPTGQKFEIKNYIPINEANPDALIGHCTGLQDINTIDGVKNASQFINVEPFEIGKTYDVRRWRTDVDGNPTYLALSTKLHTNVSKVNEQAQSSVLKAIEIYLKATKLTEALLKAKQSIQKEMGIDLTTPQGLQEYLNHFIKTQDGDYGSGDTNEMIARLGASVNANLGIIKGTPFITIHKHHVMIGSKLNAVDSKTNTSRTAVTWAKNTSPEFAIDKVLKEIEANISKFYLNIKDEALRSNKNMSFINADYSTEKGTKYHDYLKDNITTNIKSFNVGTKENPVWATAYQPVINFTWNGRQEAVSKENLQVQEDSKKINVSTEIAHNPLESNTEKTNAAIQIQELQDKIDRLEKDRKKLEALGVDVDGKIDKLKKDSGIIFKEPSYHKLTDENVSNMSKKLITINQLNTTNKAQLVTFISRKILSQVDATYKSEISYDDINKLVSESFEKIFSERISEINLMKGLYSDMPDVVEDLNKQLHNIDIVRENYDALIDEARNKEIYKYTGLTPKANKKVAESETNETPEEIKEEDNTETNNESLSDEDNADSETISTDRVKEYTKTSLEENGKSSITYRLRRFFAQLPSYKPNGDIKRGFLGIEEYLGFDYYYNKLQQMLTSPSDLLEPTFENAMERLNSYIGTHPFVKEVICRLNASDEQMKAAFVNGMFAHGISTNQMMFGDRKGKQSMKVFSVNSSEKKRLIQDAWYEQFNHSPLAIHHIDESMIDVKVAKNIIEQFNTWNSKNLPKELEIQKWLEKFGITLSASAVRELISNGYYVNDIDGTLKKFKYNQMFTISDTTNGLFGLLVSKLKHLVQLSEEDKSTDFIEDEDLHPLHDVSGVFDKIAAIEAKYDNKTSTSSHKDGDKSIFDQTPPKLATQLANRLLNDVDYRNQKLSITFDRQSYLLNMLNQFDALGNKISLQHVAITALKEYGTKPYGGSELVDLSDKDHEYLKIIGHQDIQQGSYQKEKPIKFIIGQETFELPFRIATILFPTMSDKKTMLNMRLPILHITKKSFEWNNRIVRIPHERVIPTSDFETWKLGEFEGKHEDDHKDEIKDYTINHPDEPIGKNGESFNQFRNRTLSAFHNLLETAPNNAMILTHSSVLKMFNVWNEMGRPEISKMSKEKLKEFATNYNKSETNTGDIEKFKSTNGTLIVGRHGETEDNLAGNLRSPNTQLTLAGISQAENIGEQLKNTPISTIYSSDLSRAVHTSNIIMGKLEGLNPITQVTEHQTINGIADNVKNYLFSQIIAPELNRIIKHHADAKLASISPDKLINQKDVNKGRQIFHFISELNNVTTNDNTRLIEYIANHADLLQDPQHYQELMNDVKDKLIGVIENTINNLVEQKLEIWKRNGYFELNQNNEITKNTKLNQKYLDSFGDRNIQNTAKLAVYDFVISNMVTNANMYMLFAGDIANYSQDKVFKEEMFTDNVPYKAINNDAYKIIGQQISVNMGKRLALLIASGKSILCKPNERYLQLFLKDQNTHTTNGKYLIDLFYPNQKVEGHTLVSKLDNATKEDYDKTIKEISNKFPLIADYFNIESTDAQEYMTSKEAIDLLFKQGRMSDEEHANLITKINGQRKAEKAGQSLTKDLILSDKELHLIFSPIKPVVTDVSPNPIENNSRVTYIKSSSFALLPQLTLGTELDGLRRHMEEVEDKSGYNVRASYTTANKVGSVLKENELQIWNQNGTYNKDAINVNQMIDDLKSPNGVTKSARLLQRQYFRIQQDVPFKSAKRKADTISVGTQMMKEIFGDGITDISEKIFEVLGHTMMNGRELLNHFNDLHVRWIANEKSRLYEDIGVDEATGLSKDLNTTISKLQEILEEEATKRGYPRQDIEALKLEKNNRTGKSQFTIPLWLSPNSNRYEALLNSIVSNRLAKLKMPGNSFVTASEAGFNLQTDLKNVNGTRVVYTSKYKGELTATYTEDGKLSKAQILLPSKFRNNKGELIDLTSNKYSYTDSTTGRKMLREEMIDSELLQNSTFRIPTSGHVSMSQVEIVGFLPVECADMAIVPKNFTKQKGLDFDVDKENIYQLWHTTDETGKVVPISNNDERTDDRKYQSRLLQNDIVRTYSSILGNKDARIQKKINRVLSMDFAREQADMLEELANQNSNDTFTPLSDEYQKYKMGLGAAGKTGIGIYSNYVVMHSLIQQSEKNISLTEKKFIAEDEETKILPINITIGNQFSDGRLGKLNTLYGSRSIAEVLAEMQNTATDNEKEQIMGRCNVNGITINVHSILVALGFDKGRLRDNSEISISYFLLSQPILKDYVTMVENANSITSEYDKNKQEKIIQSLINKYGGKIFTTEDKGNVDIRDVEDNVVEKLREDLSAQKLHDNLNIRIDDEIQQAVLYLFLQLDSYSDTLSTLQSKLNIQRTGLGKSAFEMLEKYNNPKWFMNNTNISNIDSLIGDYVEITEDNAYKTAEEWNADGYTRFVVSANESFYVKPTTPIGAILVNTTHSGKELWEQYFPHSNPTIAKELNQVILSLGKDNNVREKKVVELKQDIFNEMKKYLFSSPMLGMFYGNDTVATSTSSAVRDITVTQRERNRLFFDRENNKSLAGYLSELSRNPEFKQIIDNNKLLSSFTFKLEKNNLPSLVKYNASNAEDFQEEYKYQALVELMDMNTPLPELNGDKEYNTRKLAHDLIIYTYLSGGIQKAIEFVKYVPVPYLQEIGFTKMTQKWQEEANNSFSTMWKELLGFVDKGSQSNDWAISRFARQYIQHNPDKVFKTNIEMMVKTSIQDNDGKIVNTKKPKSTNSIMSFELIGDTAPKPFVSLYNKDIIKGSKYQLYQFDGKVYRRIPVLGIFGMSEYNIRENNATSLVTQLTSKDKVTNQQPIIIAPMQMAKVEGRESLYELDKGDIKEILKNITEVNQDNISDNFKGIIALTNLISPYVHKLPINITALGRGRGEYTFAGNKENINIDKDYLNDITTTDYMVARTILHETIHSITAKELAKYFDKENNIKVPISDIPAHVTKLIRVFNDVQRKMAKEIAELKEYYKNNPDGTLSKESDRLGYGAMSIFEFAAMIMSEPEFQQKMAEFRYKTTDKNLLEAFLDAIKNILEVVGIKFRNDSLAAHGIDAVLRLIDNTEENQNTKVENTPITPQGVTSIKDDLSKLNIIKEDDIFAEPKLSDSVNPDTEDWKKEENNNTTDCIF